MFISINSILKSKLSIALLLLCLNLFFNLQSSYYNRQDNVNKDIITNLTCNSIIQINDIYGSNFVETDNEINEISILKTHNLLQRRLFPSYLIKNTLFPYYISISIGILLNLDIPPPVN